MRFGIEGKLQRKGWGRYCAVAFRENDKCRCHQDGQSQSRRYDAKGRMYFREQVDSIGKLTNECHSLHVLESHGFKLHRSKLDPNPNQLSLLHVFRSSHLDCKNDSLERRHHVFVSSLAKACSS
jgi:hypothetical protein